jgi:hypothetical protein
MRKVPMTRPRVDVKVDDIGGPLRCERYPRIVESRVCVWLKFQEIECELSQPNIPALRPIPRLPISERLFDKFGRRLRNVLRN